MTFDEALSETLKRAHVGTLAHGDLELLLAHISQLEAKIAELSELQTLVEKIKE